MLRRSALTLATLTIVTSAWGQLIGSDAGLSPSTPIYSVVQSPAYLGASSLTSATTTSANAVFPVAASTAYFQIVNAGAYPVSYATGGSGIVATVNNTGAGAGVVAAGATVNFQSAANSTYLAVIKN